MELIDLNQSDEKLLDTSHKNLSPYLFDVETRRVGYGAFPNDKLYSAHLKNTDNYNAIVRAENDKLISIMPSTYQLVANKEVILPVLEFLDTYDNKWYIDNTHSYVEDGRMRLQITFPELTVNDGISDVALSLFLHNSYNGTEGVRGFWGAIRGICSNGMVFGELLGSFYHRHTTGINIAKLKQQVISSSDKLPILKQRIELLQNTHTDTEQLKKVESTMGKKIMKYVDENYTYTDSQYKLLNVLTYYISHNLDKHLRARYQMQVSKLFNL